MGAFGVGTESEGLDGATAGHFEGCPGREVKVEMEAAEVRSSLEWNLSRHICLASAMRADSVVTGMALVLFHGSRSLLGSRLGLISSRATKIAITR
jgi:hypothetical protein